MLTNEEVKNVKKVFYAFDIDLAGELDENEVYEGMKLLGVKNPRESTRRLFAIADVDKDGNVGYTEWVNATLNFKDLLSD